MLDLVSDEAANSVYLANALDGDADVGADFAEDELDAPSMQAELARFGPDLVARWVGALYALNPRNPDAARHFCTSAREVVISIIDLCAPDNDVAATDPGCARTDSGAVTRRAKVTFLLRRRGINTDAIAEAVDANVNNVLSLFRTFNDATHGHAGRFTIGELSAIRTRVESAIGFLHTLTSGPAPS